MPIAQLPAPLYRPTPWWRKVWSIIAGSVLAVIMGAVIATVVAFAVAWSVITLTDMLRQ